MTIHTWGFPQTPVIKPPRPIYVTKVACTTDESGNCSINSRFVNGEILKILYDRGTVTATTTAVITFESEQIDSYNVNSAAVTHRYPRVATINAEYVVSGLINVAVTGGQASKTFDVYVFSR
jgi:hypothetical protein